MRSTDCLSIGQLSTRTGVAVSAIRYYEKQKLIYPDRNAGGQRQFIRSDIRRLSFIRVAQQFGFSIDQIRVQLDLLPNGRTPTKADWTKISKNFRATLDTQINTLINLRDRLDGCIGCGCLSFKKCHLYNPMDTAAAKGDGPRYLLGDTPDIE